MKRLFFLVGIALILGPVSGFALDPAWLKNKVSNIRFYGDTTYIMAKSGLEMRVGNEEWDVEENFAVVDGERTGQTQIESA